VIEIIEIKSQNHLYKSIRTLQKERKEFAVFYHSEWDNRSNFILKSILRQNKLLEAESKTGVNLTESLYPILFINSFETPELFSSWEKTLPCTSVPTCYFYISDKKLREYKIYQEVLPSRILRGLNIFE
jgi:hypothetical protein